MERGTETVLITGASSGIGREIARWFAANRSADTLLLAARSVDRLNFLKDELSLVGVRTHVFPCDLSAPDGADQLLDSVRGAGHQVSILVNNAGLGAAGKFLDVSLDSHEDVIRLNIATLTRLTYLCLPDLRAARTDLTTVLHRSFSTRSLHIGVLRIKGLRPFIFFGARE